MEFGFDNGPHLKDKDHTSKIMLRLLIALLPIVLFAIYKNGILLYIEGYTDLYGAIKPLLMILIACFTSVLTEVIYFRFILKKKDDLVRNVKESFALFPGLYLALLLPINTPLWIVIIGSFVATFIGKLLFGGFGYNVFNPALVGSIFIIASYGSVIASQGGYLNAMEIDAVAGATALSNIANVDYVGSFANIVEPFGSLWDFFLGFIPGSLGETSKVLIIIGFIYLAVTKVIEWVIPVSYVAVVFLMTLIVGFMNDMSFWYPMVHIMSGGLLFGAVFMATDPVTSPTTKVGQVLFGLSLGLLTVIFRFLTPYPEGVLTAILTMNMLVFILDRIGAKAKFKAMYGYVSMATVAFLIVALSIYIGNGLDKEGPVVDEKFEIIDVQTSGNQTIYEVNQKGFKGLIKAVITIEEDDIVAIDILSQHESYWSEIEKHNYLENLITGQENLDDVDTVSGATVSSNALKSMVRKTLKDYEVRQ